MPEPEEPAATQWNREYGERMDDMGMQLIQVYSARIDDALAKVTGTYTAVVDDRSSLRLDDRYLGSWRGSGHTSNSLNAAVDALQTLRLVALENRTIPMTALYPLLRQAIENGALAIYLLAPPLRDERLRRTYWVAYDDARLRSVHEQERGSTGWAEKLTEVRDELRALIAERGTLGDPATFAFPRIQYSELVKNADEVLAADPAVNVESEMSLLAMWQLLSGLSHGKQWAMIEVLERSQAVVDLENASAHVRMTTSPGVIAWFLERALQVVECGLRLYGQRSKVTWAQPEDAQEPPSVPYVEQRRERQERQNRPPLSS